MEQQTNLSPEDDVNSASLEDNEENASPEVAVDNTSRTRKILEGIGGVALAVGHNVHQVLYMTPEQRYAQRERNRLEEQVQKGTLAPYEADRQAREYARSMRR